MVARSYLKEKGARLERDICKAFNERGIECERVHNQGAMHASTAHDLTITLGRELKGECKRKADGWREIYGWLEASDILFLRADKKKALVVLRLSDFLEMVTDDDA